MTNIRELIDRWNTSEGRPYKGSLIDWDAYGNDGVAPPENIGCMCAQGQALHLLAGWTPAKLHGAEQSVADEATARLFNISRAHAVLLRQINDNVDGAPAIVLTDPGKILGDQWRIILAFWLHLDTLTSEQWGAAGAAAWDAAGAAAWGAAGVAAWGAAGAAAWDAARGAAWVAAWVAAWGAARVAARAAAGASSEIQGAKILREKGKPFFFLPIFGFANPEEIPPLPADYGVKF